MQHLPSTKRGGTDPLAPKSSHLTPFTPTGRDRIGTIPALTSPSPTTDVQGEIEIAGRHYVRQERLAIILGVTARTLARWNARGLGPPKITIGKTVLFDIAKLPEWLATRETGPTRNPRRTGRD